MTPHPEEAPAPPPTTADRPSLLRGKAYTAPGIVVSFDVPRCIHVQACIRGLPEVFDVSARPWIRPQHADPARLAEVVSRCPSGALHAQLTGAAPEQPQVPTVVVPVPDGPLSVRGDLRISTAEGELTEVRATLCRCGDSGNRPFCDGSHARIGWKG
jgi:uncharacterized Fe-S cluster protein YjdI